jgi:hypothetical protein
VIQVDKDKSKESPVAKFLESLQAWAPNGYIARYEQGDKTIIRDAEEFRRFVLELTQLQPGIQKLVESEGAVWLHCELTFAQNLIEVFQERAKFLEEQIKELHEDTRGKEGDQNGSHDKREN